jgi:hypothetical protein
MMVLLMLDEQEWKLATAEGRTTLDYKAWRKRAEAPTEAQPPVDQAPGWHWFADGDRITIHCRKADGTTFTIPREEFKGLYNEGEKTYLEYYMWRPDGTTNRVPLDEVVGIELLGPVAPEDAEPPSNASA